MNRTMQQRRCARAAIGAAAVLALIAGSAGAGVINDPDFFDDIPNETLDWSTDGSGQPIDLIDGQSLAMPANEYAAFGITFDPPIFWVNDGNPDFDAALLLMGDTSEISIPSAAVDTFDVNFQGIVKAFGFIVVNNREADPNGPSFVARDAMGDIIGAASWGDPFILGSVGVADYGFMGFCTDVPIASITISKQAAIFGTFRYSPVPAPSAALLLGIATPAALRRRRRSRG